MTTNGPAARSARFAFLLGVAVVLIGCSDEPTLAERCAELEYTAADAWDDIYELQDRVAERLELGCP